MSRASEIMPMLSVADMAASLQFYRERLGGQQSYQFPPEGEPEFLTLKFGASEIGIGRISATPLHGQPQRPATGHRIELCIYIDDVDSCVAELEADAITVLAPPADQPWGERTAFVSDPDANIVMLVMRLE
ncbi:VOC family protein [Pelagibacterium luteolum]|uniref:Lactoylglutathione lyase n=1 Tax=Pelagibacterium luteolum TaxID=440168 RepID=A0A1G7WQW1_9HYPH|nr:VOC family protein [Pelagibacterium luteolum]SDG74264.1 lactoylglutathione lyase [Pelagibacterium luteolum]